MTNTTVPNFKNDPIVVLILSIVTCGLYLIYWNVKTAEVLNAVTGREVLSQPIAIFSGCCSPVHLYFYYVVAQDALPKLYEATSQPQRDQTVLLMILGFFFPMVAAMIVQGEVNKLYTNV
jgi:hypothetical protein